MVVHDERVVFKKEVRALKPYADRHKKVLEKQRKGKKQEKKKKAK